MGRFQPPPLKSQPRRYRLSDFRLAKREILLATTSGLSWFARASIFAAALCLLVAALLAAAAVLISLLLSRLKVSRSFRGLLLRKSFSFPFEVVSRNVARRFRVVIVSRMRLIVRSYINRYKQIELNISKFYYQIKINKISFKNAINKWFN